MTAARRIARPGGSDVSREAGGAAPQPAKGDVFARKRRAILEQASQLFFEMGYETSTLDRLAERLGVTKPVLYSYFKNKGEILSEVCETGIRESLLVMDEAFERGGRPDEQLRAIIAGVTAVVMARQGYVVVYQREMKSLNRSDARRILGLRHHFDQQMARLLETGRALGVFDLDDVAMASVWIGGLLSWTPNWYAPGGRRTQADVIQSLVKTTMRIVGCPEPHLGSVP